MFYKKKYCFVYLTYNTTVVKNFPENQDLFQWPRVIPGNNLYATTVSELEVEATYEERNYSRQAQRKKNFIISDSHLTRIKKNSKEIRCILNALVEEMPNSWIILWYRISRRKTADRCNKHRIKWYTKFNYHDVDVNDLVNRILQTRLICRYYGVKSIAMLSVLVRNDNNLNKLIRKVNILLKRLSKLYGFDFMCNDRIGKDLLWRDDLHLTDEGTSFLSINFLNFFNSYHKHCNLTDWQSIWSNSMISKPETQTTTFKGASKLHNNCISRFKMIRAENFDNIIVETVNINSVIVT